MTYDDRCTDLGLMKLSCRRLRSDLIQFYKIINLVDKINWYSEPFKLNPRGGHRTRYHRENVKKDFRHYFFTNRIATPWNALPDEVVCASSVKEFKQKLSQIDLTKFL